MNRPGRRRRMLMLTDGAWDHASSRIRAAEYRPLLEQDGWTVTWVPRVVEQPCSPAGRIRYALAKRRLLLTRWRMILATRWDVVYVQRLFLPMALLQVLVRRRVPVVYDFDDAVYLGHAGWPDAARRAGLMVRSASAVIVSTPELAPFCEKQGITPYLVTTPVDVDRIRPGAREASSAACTIGWIGSPWTTGYVNDVAAALAEAAACASMRLLLVGADPAKLDLGDLAADVLPWSYEAEPDVLRRMDVGIMPLRDDDWSRGKGGYKLFLYMAAGLPVVASPVGINRSIVQEGQTGLLARTPGEWAEHLVRLCRDAALRRRMGGTAREQAVSRYSRAVCFRQLRACLEAVAHP